MFRKALSNAGLRLLMRLAPRRLLSDVDVVLVDGVRDTKAAFEKVAAALDLINENDPRSRSRVKRYIERIAVTDLDGSYGWYWHNLRACFLDPRHVEESTPANIAMTIVHEATHGRIRQVLRSSPKIAHERVEALCVRAEIWFIRRIPGTTELLENALSRREVWLSRIED